MIPTSTHTTIELTDKRPAKAEAIALLLTKGAKPDTAGLASAQAAAVNAAIKSGLATGKANQVTTQILLEDHRRVLILGTGEKFTPQSLREAAAALAKAARKQKLEQIALVVPTGVPDAVDALVTGFELGSFAYREYKGSASSDADDDNDKPVRLSLVVNHPEKQKAALDRARIIAGAQNLARTIASRPGNEINPPSLAKAAQDIAREVGLSCRVLDDKELKRLGMGGLLAVGSGSANPPRLIALEHNPKSAIRNSQSPLLVIGKSITFDTGGVSIKPAEKMGDMIYDKCGGMAVLGLMVALARLKHPGRVIGLLTSAENHLSGTAYRPGDIIKQFNGVTVEITNTDAEGRLVLADAIAWGIKTYKPRAVVDLATLTGGCVVALGHTQAGLFSNHDDLARQLLDAAAQAGEKAWRLPVGPDQRDMLKSNHADIVNSAGRWASPLTGAAFLTFALGEKWETAVPWAHLDIAGVADTDKELPLYAKGATGWGVRTLVNWVSGKSV